jgi:acid phosphatase (class A)
LILPLVLVAATTATKPSTRYITVDKFDMKALLPEPPADDSKQTRCEVEYMLVIQQARTPEEVARAASEVVLTHEAFAAVIGPSFNFREHPATDALLRQVEIDTDAVAFEAKRFWNRPRPYDLDPRIKPAIDKHPSAAYPSGHSSRAYSWAIVMGELFPQRKDALLARAAQVAQDRVIGGVHYPSDITAGRKVGTEVARKILTSEKFQADLVKAKAELADSRQPAENACASPQATGG